MGKPEIKSKSNPLVRSLEKKLKQTRWIDPSEADTLRCELGHAYLDCGEFEKALDLFRALPEDSCLEEKLQGIFRAYIDSRRFDDAKKLIPRISVNFPESYGLLNLLGLYHYRTDDCYEALHCFDRALKETSGPDEIATVLYNKAIALNQVGYFEEALKILKLLVEAVEDDGYMVELAYCYCEKGEPRKAIRIYEGLRKKGVLTINVYGGLYVAYTNSGDHAKALAVASAGVKRFPREYPGLYEDLAEAYRHAGLSERNPAALKKALDIARDGLEIFPGYERLVEVRASIEDDASFLEDDLRMDEWRKIFRESSLMEDKRPILVMLRFELGGDSDDQLFETMHDYLARKPWFQAGKMYDYDDADKVILYRKNVGMGLDDYLETTSKVKRGAKVVFLEVDGRRVEKLSPKTIELCKERPFTILQCTLKFNEKETRVTGAKWTRLAGN